MREKEEELALLRASRTEGVLDNVNEGNPLDPKICVISCADGNYISGIVTHMSVGRSCVHTLAMNGGGLLLSESCELNQGEDVFLLRHMAVAMKLKGLTHLAPLVHYPCGAAGMAKIAIEDVLWHLCAAAERLRQKFPDATVTPLIHIDWGDGRVLTYRVNEMRFRSWYHRLTTATHHAHHTTHPAEALA